MAHAKAEYEIYLRLYPDGEGAIRVRNRLDTLFKSDKVEHASVNGKDQSPWKKEIHGSLYQYYLRDETVSSPWGKSTNFSELSSNLHLNYKLYNDDYEIRSAFTGGYDMDFSGDDNESRISEFWVDARDRNRNIFARMDANTRVPVVCLAGSTVSF